MSNAIAEALELIEGEAKKCGRSFSERDRHRGLLDAYDILRTVSARRRDDPGKPRFVWSRVDPGDMDYWEVTLGFGSKDDAETYRRLATELPTESQSIPDLLEALKAWTDYFADFWAHGSTEDCSDDNEIALKKLTRTAIAKASGERS